MTGEILSLLMFLAACGVLLLGFPVAFSLAGTALAFALLGWGMDVFDMRLLAGLPSRYFGVMVNEVLVAVPLFVFMGVMLERARIAEQLLETMGLLFGRLRGGLAYSVTIVGMLLAASTGIVGATVVTMGLLSLPAMLRAGYDPKLACGTICAAGTLGQIIPPSIVLVILGDIIQGANSQAQLALGNFAPEPVSVVDLFAGAVVPGLLLVGLYLAYEAAVAFFRPQAAPALALAGDTRAGLGRRVMVALVPPGLLVLAVLGAILSGLATPTESAAFGGVGAMLLALARRRLDLGMLREVARRTTMITSMVFVILLGASVFS
ncbi:MAG TPA: TRAP transporter large permease subunit, partial [Rhodospirillales bacterium]|nr:TRAP transporter large permease subunit [Rhodospirillales bacterium]